MDLKTTKEDVMTKKASEHLVAYFDILGYQNIIQEMKIEESELINVIEQTTKLVSYIAKDAFTSRSVKTYCFSDNFAIAIKLPFKANEDVAYGMTLIYNLQTLIFIMQLIQKKLLLEYGVFIRGSIVKGTLFAHKNFLFGKGLIDAYLIENDLAVNPRIIVEYSLVKYTMEFIKSHKNEFDFAEEINDKNCFHYFIDIWCMYLELDRAGEERLDYNYKSIGFQKDMDNEYFVDYLRELVNHKDDKDEPTKKIALFLTDEEACEISFFHELLIVYCHRVLDAIRENASSRKILIKYLWCSSYINHFCNENDIEQPFTVESIQYFTGVNLKNAKYCDLIKYLMIY